MTAATISDNAGGAWTRAAGDPVEILERAANGLSVRVQMPKDATFGAKAGRKCWLPASWVDGLQPEPKPEPKCCPTCGRELEES